MKKFFTLMAVAMMAICAQAQEKVLFASDGAYGNGATLTSENTKLVLGNDRAAKNYDLKLTSAKAYCAELFGQQVMVENSETGEMEEKTRIAYVVGGNNPKDGDEENTGGGYKPEKGNLPHSGTYYMITPSKDGHITAFIICNANKNLFVAKASDGSCLPASELTVKRDGDEPENVEVGEDFILVTEEKTTGTLEFNVVANETYYVFCTGSKLSFGGYVFEEFGEVEPLPEGEKVPVDITSGWSTWQETESVEYNADGTMTFNSGEWGGMAKWLGGRDLSGYDYLVVEFAEPTTVLTQLFVQFDAEGDDNAITKQANPGATYVFIDLNDERAKAVNQIALQAASPSVIKIASMYYIKKPGGEEPADDGEKVSLIDSFNYTWNKAESFEKAEDGTITFNAVQWGGLAGWFAPDDVPSDWSEYTKIVFEFAEPTTVETQILVKNGDNDVASAWGEIGIKKLECSFDGKDVSQVTQCALQAANPATLKITAIYLVKKGGAGPVVEDGWVELVKNGDVEGEDGTSLLTKNGDGDGSFIFNAVAGAGVDGSRAAVVHAVANAANEWDSQFFIYAPDHKFVEGETYKVSFKVRADKATSVSVQAHKEPGSYLHWTVITNGAQLNITTDWTEVTYEGVATAEMNDMQTIAFNLNQDKTLENNYYFDNISWKLKTDAEGITEVGTARPVDGIRYNLSGMRVSDSYKGVVIMNGRKFIQK